MHAVRPSGSVPGVYGDPELAAPRREGSGLGVAAPIQGVDLDELPPEIIGPDTHHGVGGYGEDAKSLGELDRAERLAGLREDPPFGTARAVGKLIRLDPEISQVVHDEVPSERDPKHRVVVGGGRWERDAAGPRTVLFAAVTFSRERQSMMYR